MNKTLGTVSASMPFGDGNTSVRVKVVSRSKGGTQLLTRILKHIANTSIDVGFFDPKNAAKAYLMEKGGISRGFIRGKAVPKRPFMRRALDAKKDKAHKIIKEAISEAFETRRIGGIDRAFNEVGEMLVEEIRKKIRGVHKPPLSTKSTIPIRKRRGNNSKKALIDTGEMYDAVSYSISEKGLPPAKKTRRKGNSKTRASGKRTKSKTRSRKK